MKSVLISIKPKWVEKILNGEKTIEIRKTMPKCKLPIKCYIYCTKDKNNILAGTSLVNKSWKCWNNKEWNNQQKKDVALGKYNGKVVAEFTLNKIEKFQILPDGYCYTDMEMCQKSCMIYDQIERYIGKNKIGYAWYIDNLKIYAKPKELEEFCNYYKDIDDFDVFDIKSCYRLKRLTRPPQSWCYVEV